MTRPKDINGDPIVMGPWYWARNRNKSVLGVGNFYVVIGGDDIAFWINGVGYDPDCYTFEKAIPPMWLSRAEQAEKQSYDDLTASGGIVGAP